MSIGDLIGVVIATYELFTATEVLPALFWLALASVAVKRKTSHDRWLITDDRLYHCGHSLDSNGGHKISAVTLMGTPPEVILSQIE